MVKLQMQLGITRFKCATIAEAEMLAECNVQNILLAYPLVGPNIARFVLLEKTYPHLYFWAIGDDFNQIKLLGECSNKNGIVTKVLIDMNLGMNRTGISVNEAVAFFEKCSTISGIELNGLHCYDGNHGIQDITKRQAAVDKVVNEIQIIKDQIASKGLDCSVLVMGGTPSFPCHAKYPDVYLSPGTLFISDFGYSSKYLDMNFIPGATILTRVVSHPQKGYFTLDLGYKGIAADPQGSRGYVVGLEHYIDVGQNEEHWIFKMEEGYENQTPGIEDVLYVIPTHICPTSALYPDVLVVDNGEIVDTWTVTARNRKINI
jgi:D-serine deaminase-like pyridoxal phosphate-dependent protein